MRPAGEPEPGAGSDRLKVSVADYAVAAGRTLATSGLGSCLGIALYAPESGVGALVHPMLPFREDAGRPRERFVDSGVRLALEALSAREAGPVEAKLTGGATIVRFEADPDGPVGERNVAAAREVLAAEGVGLVGEEVGGDAGRSMRFDTATGQVVVRRTDGVETVL